MWVQLEGVLSSSEVSQYLPTQHFMFSTMDKEWRALMRDTAKAPNVLNICLQEGMNNLLRLCLQTYYLRRKSQENP